MTNGVSLLVHASGGSMSVDEAKTEVMKRIDASRRKLLSLVVSEQEGPIPRPCKQLFWKMCKILHLFYYQTDGFSSPKEMVSAVDAVIKEPLQLRLLQIHLCHFFFFFLDTKVLPVLHVKAEVIRMWMTQLGLHSLIDGRTNLVHNFHRFVDRVEPYIREQRMVVVHTQICQDLRHVCYMKEQINTQVRYV